MSSNASSPAAIVTGASRGIGAELARRLAADGYAVVVNHAHSAPEAEALVAEPATAEGTWLVFDEGQGRGQRLADEIAQRGGQALRVLPSGSAAGAGATVIDETQAGEYARLMAKAAESGALRGVVSLWPLRVPALRDDDLPSAVQRFGVDAALLTLQALA
ncbi:MAG: SDR family NAD(P)-dependent oxidoreductase, partial [Sphingopyxis sp.]